ncbi:MAG: bifunctional phosphopantothenoylcysteine decarboxylase/phosphopantothenate--cysteine ligase CoaBC [Candidatus Promineifilaceae bacterium]|nr:bifunctional phosphopantothenoylcysteine decarboxylase/phosphopantothenate--cysteine ligase CoaBC [Candidatus Promineifilaceae bacterium]
MSITVLENRVVVLGVTGSIACYKSADLASKLTQAGAHVETILTESATRFVTPLTFRSVTGRAAYTDMWSLDDHVRHVQLGEQADLFVVAPATAQTIGKLAAGLADNLLTVSLLAARCPVVVAPAMDGAMYEHPATQGNVAALRERGVTIVGPLEGRMASGLVGRGRMAEPWELLGHVRRILGQDGPLAGRRVVVTAGPTRERLDPVRFLSNRSSGKQGVALAQAAVDAGASAKLVLGPVEAQVPVGVEVVRVESAREMAAAVLAAVEEADVLLMAAAVSDFRPAEAAAQKVKKVEADARVGIDLARNPDILIGVKAWKERSGAELVTVGFAAETENALAYGRRKLAEKGLDLIVVNDVSQRDAGFQVDNNRVTLVSRQGDETELPLLSKAEVAERIIQHVATFLDSGV